ncbi:MAG TPA: hypothetical protein VEG65_04690 [Candidatus Bathyarchaeia archaeon]|nr:hypothetical protein [Candidatus Bathyarchaeia archaeon]
MKLPSLRGGVAGAKYRHKDDIAWWMRRYESLCTTEAEDVIQRAVAMLNDAVVLRDEALDLVGQLDHDIIQAEDEIKRLGGTAFIEKLEPMLEELSVYFESLYESLKRPRP